ncbi:MAG: hypothetical protein UW28_C0020G0014 [Parcubacteria group bacterium GW2011_GWA2_44_13]|nr:MAG: hypothetical protein UW28_C0020G0014 [Parcubacteria group bacterium GW2011_GWA2_44_13]
MKRRPHKEYPKGRLKKTAEIPMKLWYFFIQIIGKISLILAVKIFFKLEIAGRERAKLLKGPLVIVSNHKSFIDHFLIAVALPFNFRLFPIRPRADAAQMGRPILGLGIRILGGFLAKTKGKNLDDLFDIPDKILKSKGVVLLYPEASILRDSKIHEAKSVGAEIALRGGANILPLAISGMDYFYEKDAPKLIFNRRKIKISFGDVFPANCCKNRKILTKKIESEIRALYEPGYK